MDKLKHAKHNESVSRYLSPKQDYADWVVITAFYSAIHFVEHKIFPYNAAGNTFQTMKQYFIAVKHTFPGRNKHAWRQELVGHLCSEISASYNWLFATCNTARYSNYEFPQPRQVSKRATEELKKIKDFCTAR